MEAYYQRPGKGRCRKQAIAREERNILEKKFQNQPGYELGAFWFLVRCSYHWAARPRWQRSVGSNIATCGDSVCSIVTVEHAPHSKHNCRWCAPFLIADWNVCVHSPYRQSRVCCIYLCCSRVLLLPKKKNSTQLLDIFLHSAATWVQYRAQW